MSQTASVPKVGNQTHVYKRKGKDLAICLEAREGGGERERERERERVRERESEREREREREWCE